MLAEEEVGGKWTFWKVNTDLGVLPDLRIIRLLNDWLDIIAFLVIFQHLFTPNNLLDPSIKSPVQLAAASMKGPGPPP